MSGFDVLESKKRFRELDEHLRSSARVMMFFSSDNAKDREYIVNPLTKPKLHGIIGLNAELRIEIRTFVLHRNATQTTNVMLLSI